MLIRAGGKWGNIADFKFKRASGWTRSTLVYQKDNGVWKIAHRNELIEEFQIRVGTFNAPQVWYGFFKQGTPDPGTVSPGYYRGYEVRDFNSPDNDQLGLQFGLYNKGDSSKAIAIEVEGLGRLPFRNTNQNAWGNDTVTRRWFSDGTKNVHQYLKSQYGKTLTIKVIHDPV